MLYVKHLIALFSLTACQLSFLSYMVHDIPVHVDFTRDIGLWDGPQGGTSDQ